MKGEFYKCWVLSLSSLSMCEMKVAQSCPIFVTWPHGLYGPWDSPGQNTGVGSLFILQGIFPTRDQTHVSRIAGGFFTSWATKEALSMYNNTHLWGMIECSGYFHCIILFPLQSNHPREAQCKQGSIINFIKRWHISWHKYIYIYNELSLLKTRLSDYE